jgi:hypothetical protein
VSEDVVEGSVLEEHQHDVLESVGLIERRHQLRLLISQTLSSGFAGL